MAKEKRPTTPSEIPHPGKYPEIQPTTMPDEPAFPEEEPEVTPETEPTEPSQPEIPLPPK